MSGDMQKSGNIIRRKVKKADPYGWTNGFDGFQCELDCGHWVSTNGFRKVSVDFDVRYDPPKTARCRKCESTGGE